MLGALVCDRKNVYTIFFIRRCLKAVVVPICVKEGPGPKLPAQHKSPQGDSNPSPSAASLSLKFTFLFYGFKPATAATMRRSFHRLLPEVRQIGCWLHVLSVIR